jgi:hypothetical protein
VATYASSKHGLPQLEQLTAIMKDVGPIILLLMTIYILPVMAHSETKQDNLESQGVWMMY